MRMLCFKDTSQWIILRHSSHLKQVVSSHWKTSSLKIQNQILQIWNHDFFWVLTCANHLQLWMIIVVSHQHTWCKPSTKLTIVWTQRLQGLTGLGADQIVVGQHQQVSLFRILPHLATNCPDLSRENHDNGGHQTMWTYGAAKSSFSHSQNVPWKKTLPTGNKTRSWLVGMISTYSLIARNKYII